MPDIAASSGDRMNGNGALGADEVAVTVDAPSAQQTEEHSPPKERETTSGTNPGNRQNSDSPTSSDAPGLSSPHKDEPPSLSESVLSRQYWSAVFRNAKNPAGASPWPSNEFEPGSTEARGSMLSRRGVVFLLLLVAAILLMLGVALAVILTR